MKAPIAFAIGCIFTTLLTDSVSAVHCNKQHTVVDGDTCKSIAQTYKISEKVIDRLNPSVDSVCDHLEDGLKLCVGSSIKSLNKASPKTTSKKTIHTKKKMTTIIKSKKKTSAKKPSKKVSKKVSKKATKSADGATPTPAVRNKDPKEGTAKAQKMKSADDASDASNDGSTDSSDASTDDSSDVSNADDSTDSTDDSTETSDDNSPQPTDDGSDDSTDESSDASTDDNSTDSADDSSETSDDNSSQPADNGSNESPNGPTPTEDSANNSDDGSAQPTDDGSNEGPGAGPQPDSSNTTEPALNYFDTLTVQLTSADDFCLLLPSSPGGKKDNNNKMDVEAISKSEGSAVSFCLKKSAEKAPKAQKMPEGLIKSAYFYKNETGDYSQISGTINPKAYMLSEKDYGGQYDNHGKGAPANSMCYGYKYFVELIEPNTHDFCIRCCNVYEDCNAGRSAYGCQRVVSNGRYT